MMRTAGNLTVFTGAGVSVESGIPPFRGSSGLWQKYDPQVLDLGYFHHNPLDSWRVIREIFYDFFGKAKPNAAHLALAKLEEMGLLRCIITQNIDNLHQEAGNTIIHEFHGNSQVLRCTQCEQHFPAGEIDLAVLPPKCLHCGALLKPDFIFFGEAIPMDAFHLSQEAARIADVFVIIGSTGEVMPANQIPVIAKQSGAKIIEINPEPSHYTHAITDVYLGGKAGEIMPRLMRKIENNLSSKN
ncbi:MAG: NAD-dependent deacylase [Bacteroidales bacterium]|jgi:NAD-dependent deacetylase|nr:NAD-dependent deacylase [Candidatus Falkowbacteria bacterium]NLO49933.1 NAD-dependent deacylase [Bacteroidales bacterium]